MREDGVLKPPQLHSRLQTQLRIEQGARLAIDRQGVGLATASIQRQHQLRAQPLAQRVGSHQALQLGHQLPITADQQISFDASLDRL